MTPVVQSLIVRVILAVHLALPQLPPALLSPDPALHAKLQTIVLSICTEIASGTASNMSKSLGLIVGSSLQHSPPSDVSRQLQLLLHPRAPPLVRSLPEVETLSLFRAEESLEELETRRKLGLITAEGAHPSEALVANTPIEKAVQLQPNVQITPTATAPLPVPTQPMSIASTKAISAAPPKTTTPQKPSDVVPSRDEDIQMEHSSILPSPMEAPQSFDPSIQPPANPQAGPSSLVTPALHAVRVAVEDTSEDEDDTMPRIDMDSDSDS